LGREIDAAMKREIVGHHRQPHGAADFDIVIDQFLRGGLEVIRRDRDNDIDADLFGLARERDSVAGGDASHVAEEEHAAGSDLAAPAHGDLALFHIEGVKLALRTAREHTVYTARDLRVDEHLPGVIVDALICFEGRYERGNYPLEGTIQHVFRIA